MGEASRITIFQEVAPYLGVIIVPSGSRKARVSVKNDKQKPPPLRVSDVWHLGGSA